MSLFYQGKYFKPEIKEKYKFRNKLIAVSCAVAILGSAISFRLSASGKDVTITQINADYYSALRKNEDPFINGTRVDDSVIDQATIDATVETIEATEDVDTTEGTEVTEFIGEETVPETVSPAEALAPMSVEEYIDRFYTVSSGLSADELEVFLAGVENEGSLLFGDNEVFREFINREKKCNENVRKLDFILADYGITKEQFIEIGATVLAEAASNYEDQYHVSSVILNRLCNTRWTDYISSVMGGDKGNNIYYQVICPGQFTAYRGVIYYQMLNLDLDKYQAVLDCFSTEIPSNNYLSFKSYETTGSERLAPRGNYYHEYFDESERKERKHYIVEGSNDYETEDESQAVLTYKKDLSQKTIQFVKN